MGRAWKEEEKRQGKNVRVYWAEHGRLRENRQGIEGGKQQKYRGKAGGLLHGIDPQDR